MLLRRRDAWTLLAALGLHAAAIAFLSTSHAPGIAERASAPAHHETEVAWDIDLGAEPPRALPTHADAPAPALNQDGHAPSRRAEAPPPATITTEPEQAPDESVPEPAPQEGVVAERPIDLGLGSDAWQRWVGAPNTQPPPAASTARVRSNRFQVFRAPPASTTGGVQEGLEKRDRELGLGPSGRVLSALHQAAHETVAPATGTATFHVTVLSTGAIEVKLGSASAQPDAWNQVAKRIAERLRAAPPRIPPPREGARLVLELVAEETMPNGTKISSLKGPHLDATPLKLRSTEDEQRQLSLDNPTAQNGPDKSELPPIQLDLPGVYLAERGKVCSYRLGLSALGPVFQGGCDPSHIGAKPQRMVHARVLEESLF